MPKKQDNVSSKTNAKSAKSVKITNLKDLPKGAKLKDANNSFLINDDPRKMDIPLNSPEIQRRLDVMSPEKLKRFTEMFGTLYIEE